MNRKPNPAIAAAALRRRAEVQLREQRKHPRPAAGGPKPAADAQRLLHELQVHHVELEMQNAELQEARDRMEAQLEKYTDLYDFAPVAYFSLDDQGRIMEVNLTGANLLGVERSRLISRRLQQFVVPTSRPDFLRFLEQVFAGARKPACEAVLAKPDGAPFWVNFHGTSALSASSSQPWCRVAVSDLTSLKQAEATQRRAEVLAAANRRLEAEIVRRMAVEDALKQAEQHLTELLEAARHTQDQLRHLSRQILRAQEEERKRISRELHDVIAQTLVGINIHLQALSQKVHIDPQGLRSEIAQTQQLVATAVDIVHQFAVELRPMALDELGLIPALHSFMKELSKRTGLHIHFTTCPPDALKQLSSTRRTVLYRVTQSALVNVEQHAQASQVEVTLRKLRNTVRLEIHDDGKSFEVERVLAAKRYQRLGLLGMRERVEMVGGSFGVESKPGQGTTIRLQIPLGNGGEEELGP